MRLNNQFLQRPTTSRRIASYRLTGLPLHRRGQLMSKYASRPTQLVRRSASRCTASLLSFEDSGYHLHRGAKLGCASCGSQPSAGTVDSQCTRLFLAFRFDMGHGYESNLFLVRSSPEVK